MHSFCIIFIDAGVDPRVLLYASVDLFTEGHVTWNMFNFGSCLQISVSVIVYNMCLPMNRNGSWLMLIVYVVCII